MTNGREKNERARIRIGYDDDDFLCGINSCNAVKMRVAASICPSVRLSFSCVSTVCRSVFFIFCRCV